MDNDSDEERDRVRDRERDDLERERERDKERHRERDEERDRTREADQGRERDPTSRRVTRAESQARPRGVGGSKQTLHEEAFGGNPPEATTAGNRQLAHLYRDGG